MPLPRKAPAAEVILSGRRVALRRMAEDDIPAIEPWYGEAVAVAHGAVQSAGHRLAEARADRDAGLLVIARRDDPSTRSGQAPAPVGLLKYHADDPARGWLTTGFIAIAPALRGFGYGSEAVRLLEEWAVREGLANRFRADVDPRNGLGLYFWLRLGYRPEAGSAGVLPMVRELR